ncbi:flagellar hook-associated protein FlgK [Paraburkholderia sp. MMS20-SJTN17]|uniref:Flagellar hook-associated protein 1 n=1 Tax=Paraburkholderia translucens TaxID=2886945 RepID=A0ABS8KCL5_9BURK|nr:flagellar hook-associated protein FlgK [Paraburkholderia sp. MMS20-SJTN17]MCC8402218.1 flagellar hook-associated protein FlgK [Paraburkholderia sp. MMS20-SJTN17]
MSSNLFSIGLSGLNAAQWGLTVTGENISNVSTPGYTLEAPVYSESSGTYTGSGYLPMGVSTDTVVRQYSQYLTTELNNAQSSSSALSTYNTMISQLNNLVGSPTSGISSAISSYFTGLQNVANSASSVSARQTAISDAQTLANQINQAGQQYDQLRSSVNTQLSSTVTQINTYTAQIASLNTQITQASSQGQPPNQLLDARDQAVSNLSQLIGVSVVQDNGSYSLFMSNGQPLVLAGNSFNLGTATSASDPSELSVQYLGQAGAKPTPAPQTLSDTNVSGGTLGGLLQFRSQTLDPAEAQLGAIATSFAAQVNAQNELGLTLNGTAGGALFTVGSPTVYANPKNTGNATLSTSFANASQPTTGNYTLSYNGSTYTLTDNQTGSIVGSATNLNNPIGGLQFSVASGTMNAGDSFSIKPTSDALDNFALTTTSPSAIAAAAPVLASASTSNTGSMTVTQGTVSAGYSAPTSTSTITYTAGTGLTGFPVGSVVTVAGSPSTSYTISSATTAVPYSASSGATLTITNPTNSASAGVMNNVTVTVSGTPASGDSFTIGPNTGASNDGRNAQLLSGLTSATVLSGGTATLAGAYATYVNDIGNQTTRIQTSATAQSTLVTQITSAQQSVSGVNTNEEAANLLQYQQLYQANSKVIQAAETMFQTLLGIFQ